MASLERRDKLVPLDFSQLVVVDSLRGIPQFRDALQPDYMVDLVAPLAAPEVIWKLDHSMRVSFMIDSVLGYMGSSDDTRLAYKKAGFGHDSFQVRSSPVVMQEGKEKFIYAVEKIAVLNKPGLPTSEEWDIIHDHPEAAARYFAKYGEGESSVVTRRHHSFQGERSYPFQTQPDSLDRNQLQEIAVFAAVDTTDALFTPRPYPKWVVINGERVLQEGSTREPWSAEEVREELTKKFGKIVEPRILDYVVKAGEDYAGKTVVDFAAVA